MDNTPDEMNALVVQSPGKFGIQTVPVPNYLLEDEVLCKVDTVFICGTDVHIINGAFPGFWPREYPFIPGHEWSGKIVEIGAKAARLGWKAGDRICAISHCGCGVCRNCMSGRYNICLNYGHEDYGHRQYGHYTPGAYAQYMRTSIKSIISIPGEMDLEVAACVDPLSIALYTVKRTRLQPGENILIFGTGPQGLMAILCAKAMGSGQIIAVGSGMRLAKARELGAICIDYRDEDVVEKVKSITGGGIPRVCECSGTETSLRQACLAAAKGGVISVIGITHEDPKLPMSRIVLDEIEVIGNRANPNTAEEALSLLVNKRLSIDSLVTHRFSLSEFGTALETFKNRKDGAIKVAIKPNLMK